MDNLQHPTNVVQSIHTHSKEAIELARKSVYFFSKQNASLNSDFFSSLISKIIALKSHLTKVFC